VYVSTPIRSDLRRIIIAFFIWQAAEDWWNIDQEAQDEDDWAFKDMPEEFKTEVAIAALERIHLMDDGNPFNDHDETAQTRFGPNYFYDDDQANAATQKWLRMILADFAAKKNGAPLVSKWTRRPPQTEPWSMTMRIRFDTRNKIPWTSLTRRRSIMTTNQTLVGRTTQTT
jgi:hypothetical protein